MHIIRRGTRVVPLLIVLASVMPDRVASAQSPGRFEVGGQVSALRLEGLGATPAGFGGRFSYELLDWLSVESEFNLFPRETFTVQGTPPPFFGDFSLVFGRRRSEALFGAKLGMRTERFGLFAKVRPGFAHLSDQSTGCVGIGCAAMIFLAGPTRTGPNSRWISVACSSSIPRPGRSRGSISVTRSFAMAASKRLRVPPARATTSRHASASAFASDHRGASPLGPPTASLARAEALAPFGWLARCAHSR